MDAVSTETACWLIAIVLFLVGLALLTLGLCRVGGQVSRAEEMRGRQVWDEKTGVRITLPPGVQPGPGQLTEAQVAARDRFRLVVGDLADDPEWDAGCERLADAVRDHTNTPEGDQP